MKNILFIIITICIVGLLELMAQTHPTPQTLPYSQDFSSFTGSTTSYPSGWQGWTIAGSLSTNFSTEGTSLTDQNLAGGTNATTAAGVYDMNGKLGLLSTASNMKTACLAINTTGLQDIQVQFTAQTQRQQATARTNVLGLQYRLGTSGAFTTIPGSYYHNNTSLGDNTSGTTSLNPQTITVTLPAVCNNQSNIQLRWLIKDSIGTGNRPSFSIDNISITGNVISGTEVNLSASASSGFEASSSIITITATASAPVVGDQTVTLNVTGSNITSTDYVLSSFTITILNGQTTGSVTFTVQDDNIREALETAIVSIQSVSSGLAVGSISFVNIDIVDNDDAIVLPALNTPSTITTFNELEITGTSNTTIPRGIYFFEQGTNANAFYRADDGTQTTGDSYSYGSTSNNERAFGSLTTGNLTPNFLGAKLINNTGSHVNALQIDYVGEQWRKGGNTANDKLMFEVSVDATSLNTGTWTAFSVLDFVALQQGGTATSLDGNNPVNRQIFSEEITGFGTIAPGGTAWIRWRDVDVTGSDDGLAIDDLTITPKVIACTAPTISATNLLVNNITGTTADLTWTNGNGTARLVIVRAGSAVSDFPVNGNNYTANNNFGVPAAALGSGYVVYNGTGNTVTVSGLTPGITYHVAVVEYNCNPGEYLTITPATGNFTTTAIPAIFTNVTSLSTFSTSVGLPTLPDSIQVSGVFLTNDLQITSPLHFQISTVYNSGFTNLINLTPTSGTVPPTWIYVRYNPTASGAHGGNVSFSSTGATSVNVAVSGNAVVSGGIPTLHVLCSGDYSFTQWAATEPAGTYPSNMIFHRFNAQDPLITAQDTANYSLAYNLTGGTRINGLGTDGISFLNTGTSGNLGAAVLGLNTLGRSNITVDFTAGLLAQTDNNRVYNLTLQYRVGNGPWTDLTPAVSYTSSGQSVGHEQQFSGIVLPAACNNQPAVYLRWMYHRVGTGSGTRPRIRLDDIYVTSSPLTTPLTDIVAVPASEASIIPSSVNGPINTISEGIQVWAFTVRDGGASGDSDNLPTLIDGFTFTQGPLNTVANFSAAIAHAALFDGTVKIADGIISSGTVLFTGLNQTIPDDASKTYTIRISLTTNGSVIDGSVLQLQIAPSGIQLANACNSSLPAAFGNITSNGSLNVLDVQATRLTFAVPLNVIQNQNFSVTVTARDDQNNIDVSPRQITLSLGIPGTGTLSSATGLGPQNMNNGVFTWNDLQYNVIEAFRIIATDNSSIPLSNDTLINCIQACVAPSLPATNLTFSNVTTSSMTVSWTNGNGTGRIVIARQGAPVSDAPVNGTNYNFNINYGTSGTELGSGFVIYNGSGSSVNVMNLQSNTTYHFAIYEYSCNPELYINSALTGSQSTINNSSIDEQNSGSAWIMYPNPVGEGWVYFNQPLSFELFDISGKLILSKELANGFDATALKPGIYLVKTSFGWVKRLVVK
ncbi:MAG: T9SS type A sorting domain-containing protein [Flavobacteriales bacterium]|nr:T9SS type A sorting domain-containing protein [Flavobacteriales bacterium]